MEFTNTLKTGTFWIIVFAVAFGALLTFGAVHLEKISSSDNPVLNYTVFAAIEESLKFVAILLVFIEFKKNSINPFILAAAVAIGFATLENLTFSIFTFPDLKSYAYVIFRIPQLLLHIFTALLMASVIVKCNRESWYKVIWLLPVFLILASVFHLFFNALALNNWFIS